MNFLKPLIKTTTITILSVIFLQACNDDDDPVAVAPAKEITTIVDAAVANGGFTTLVAALQATGLDSTLSDVNGTFTVFAPTDAAFALLGQETINGLLADTDTLSNILTYHVIGSEVNATTAISLAGTTVTTVNGSDIGLSLDGSSLLVNTATVVIADIQTDNGIIHVIDAVLMPPTEMMTPTNNIVETAIAAGSFTTLVAALQAADLDVVLSNENTNFTVFAPTDAAFALIGTETINDLLADKEALTSVLLQHVIADSAVNSVTAYSLNGVMVDTASMAKISLNINPTTDMLTFGGANVVMKDIYTSNGVIHVIDAVVLGSVELPEPAMNLVEVASANDSFSILVGALQATNLDDVLSNIDNNYTVFAPTDAAFAKLPEGTLESLTNEQLADILLYHVVPGTVLSDAAVSVAGSESNKVTTANGAELSLSFVDATLYANGAKISAADVMAENGVIHVIDTVLLPAAAMVAPTMNIVEVALADENFSTLVTALSAADLVTTLSNEEATFTVFAPTNAAFAKIDPDALAALLADVDGLTSVLLTHVVADASLSALDAYAANGKSLTTASGEMIDVSIDADTGMLMIGGSTVVMSDIYTTNGVIHVIDTVILD
jgi:uncharacterized surface protein with fasciclin (FAS1) repeats